MQIKTVIVQYPTPSKLKILAITQNASMVEKLYTHMLLAVVHRHNPFKKQYSKIYQES